jgi:circadian clock protein KaiC
LDVYPRLVAAEHRAEFAPEQVASGVAELDVLFGGGIDRGTSTLLLGAAGTGKSVIATQYTVAAAGRGERSVMYIFDERIQTLLQRAEGLGLGLQQHVDDGTVEVRQIDPAELTTGQFSEDVRRAVVERDVRLVVIDSLNGYLQAMPDERLLVVYLHELFSFLNQQAVTVLSVMAQHGLPGGAGHTPVDLSYISDTVLLFRHFEFAGEVRKALSVYKRRAGPHERTIRELQFGPGGVQIGGPLREFHGILTGIPRFVGEELPHVRAGDRAAGQTG